MLEKTTALVCVALGAMLSTARADDNDSETKPAADATAPPAGGADQMTLPKGRLLLNAYLEIGLSDGAAFKPISLSPDVWYGVTDDITVGLVHSAVGGSGVLGGVGNSLCLTGTSGGCAKLYSNVGADVRYKLKSIMNGAVAWAVDGGLFASNLDPLVLAVKAGIVGRWHSGPLAVEVAPNLVFGVTNRTAGAAGMEVTVNGETLTLPGTALYTVAPKIDVGGQLAFLVPLENTGDAYKIALSIGGQYHLNESLNVSLAFSLPALVGGGSGNGIDARSLTLGGSYAF
jgi:hypothetical protein